MTSSRSRRDYDYDSDDTSEDSYDSDVDESSPLQVALRDKEEALVQSALARIRRAQEKGKRDVKLNKEELAALEKRRKRMQSAATAKARQVEEAGTSGSDRRRRREQNLVTVPLTAPVVTESSSRKKPKSKRVEEAPPHPPAATNPPGMLVAGPDGLTYAPIGYYPPQAGVRNSPNRRRSISTSQAHGIPPPYISYQQGQSSRHFSDGPRPNSSSSNGSRRPLPDEDGWVPAYSRRNSVSSNSHGPPDPFEYQTGTGHPPPSAQAYATQSSRRSVPGPSDVAYSSLRRNPPPLVAAHPAAARARASDSSLRRRSSSMRDQGSGSSKRDGSITVTISSDEDDDEDDESDELGNGVQVLLEREPVRERAIVSAPKKPAGGAKKKGKGR